MTNKTKKVYKSTGKIYCSKKKERREDERPSSTI